MSKKIIIIMVYGIIWMMVNFPCLIYAKMDFIKVYGLKDQKQLEKIILQTKDSIKGEISDKDKFKLLGIVYHNLGILKVKGAPEKAVENLEKAKQLSPDDYEILAYLGSAKTMIARDSWNVVTKISSTNRGINIMDQAVKKAPDNIAVRMVRAYNSLALPEFFKRRHIAKIDFLHIETLIKKTELNLDIETKAEIFYQIGLIYKSEGNISLAKEYFKKVIEMNHNSPWSIKAKKEL